MDSDTVIKVKDLSKCFKIYPTPGDRLREFLSPSRNIFHKKHWTLRGLSFEIKKGESVGVMGRNGTGKSTLLQLLCGVLQPTEGEVRVRGSVAGLLELGAGFDREFTGRENVYTNGAILGFTKKDMDARFGDIAEFADIGDFMDRPVKTYSSGMYVRLAFASAIHVEPDVLVVDEALSVGDVSFQRKCLRRVEKMLKKGVTFIFVSHEQSSVIQFCSRAILLEKTGIILDSTPREASRVLNKLYFASGADTEAMVDSGDGSACFSDVWVEDEKGQRTATAASGQRLLFSNTYVFARETVEPVFNFSIKTLHGLNVTGADTETHGQRVGNFKPGDTVTITWVLDLNLNPGDYFLSCGMLDSFQMKHLCVRDDALRLSIVDSPVAEGLINALAGIKVQYGRQ